MKQIIVLLRCLSFCYTHSLSCPSVSTSSSSPVGNVKYPPMDNEKLCKYPAATKQTQVGATHTTIKRHHHRQVISFNGATISYLHSFWSRVVCVCVFVCAIVVLRVCKIASGESFHWMLDRFRIEIFKIVCFQYLTF